MTELYAFMGSHQILTFFLAAFAVQLIAVFAKLTVKLILGLTNAFVLLFRPKCNHICKEQGGEDGKNI